MHASFEMLHWVLGQMLIADLHGENGVGALVFGYDCGSRVCGMTEAGTGGIAEIWVVFLVCTCILLLLPCVKT